MKLWVVLASLIALTAKADIPSRVILTCKNAGKNRTLKIEENANGQSYRIAMTDYAEKNLFGASYVLKSKDVFAEVKTQNFTVSHINNTEENYSIQVQPLYASNEQESYIGTFATLSGWSPGSNGGNTANSAKEKVFKTLVPDASKFDMQILECTN